MTTIPASQIVSVTPSVISAGGSDFSLNGVILTESTRVPVGTVAQFPDASEVGDYFGPGSEEAEKAAIYFAGFDNSNIKPGNLLFAQYNATAVAAYLRGGNITSVPIATLQTYQGSLTVVVDGYTHAAPSVNLAGATSYSNAASIINTALTASEPTIASFTGTIADTVLTVSAVASGQLAAGQTVVGSGVAAGSIITKQLTGDAGGVGTYQLAASSTVGSPASLTTQATAPAVSFDSVSGAFIVTSGVTGAPSTIAFATGTIAASLLLTQATGAVTSQGAEAASPATFMDALTNITQNWMSFTTLFNPDGDTGLNTVKMEFANWTALQNLRYAYSCWDTDQSPATQVPASSSMGQLLKASNSNGTVLQYTPIGGDATLAVFWMGAAASIDFTEQLGSITFKFKSQSGLDPQVTDANTASNLEANGYNYYGQWSTANNGFTFYAPGAITGEFEWADAYVNQVWLNNSFQFNLMTLLTNAKSVPYDPFGTQLIEASLMTTIEAALNFGAITPGVILSPQQQVEVNQQAGAQIANTIFTQGYYVQVLQGSAQTRANRTSPPCSVWYAYAGAVHKINLASIAIQ